MTLVIGVLALIAVALIAVPWNNIFPPVSNAPVAHTSPVPSPSPPASPTVAAIKVTGNTGPVCIMPTGKARHAVEVVKVP
jgi:hypothetical protein